MTALSLYTLSEKHFFIITEAFSSSYLCEKVKARLLTVGYVVLSTLRLTQRYKKISIY